jgi:hypothetical protein
MTISALQKTFATIRTAAKRPRSWVEITASGFCLKQKRFPLPPLEFAVEWKHVREIYACLWDCWSTHAFGFRFECVDGRSICVDDMAGGWEPFQELVLEVFPDIDRNRIDEADRAFPGEACLLCWPMGGELPTSGSSQ